MPVLLESQYQLIIFTRQSMGQALPEQITQGHGEDADSTQINHSWPVDLVSCGWSLCIIR